MSTQFFKVLQLIAEGYEVRGEDDRFILVENPDANDVNGLAPYHVIDMARWDGSNFDKLVRS